MHQYVISGQPLVFQHSRLHAIVQSTVLIHQITTEAYDNLAFFDLLSTFAHAEIILIYDLPSPMPLMTD